MAIVQAVNDRKSRTRCLTVACRRRCHYARGRLPKGGNLSNSIDEYLKPLSPLRNAADKSRYLDVDRSEEKFAEFTNAFKDPADWTARAHVVVVTGDSGYGKTSFIQRCAAWLDENAASAKCKVVVVDLSDERWSAEPEQGRLHRTFNWILDGLRTTVQMEDISRISSHDDIVDSFRDLGRVLGAQVTGNGQPLPPVVLVVLLQGYASPAEVQQYYNLARPGMVFFAEIFEQEAIEGISVMRPSFNRVSTEAHLLAMDVLKSGDAERLVEWIKRQGGNWPEMPDGIVREHFERIIERYKIGMSELTRLAWSTLAIAAEEAAAEVTTTHITQYYEQSKYLSNM